MSICNESIIVENGCLDLSKKSLQHMPNFIKADGIYELYLNDNNLHAIPDEVFEYKNLKVLNLNNNRIKTIPDNIKRLHNLETFIINNNIITNISKELWNLKNKTFCDVGTLLFPRPIKNVTTVLMFAVSKCL